MKRVLIGAAVLATVAIGLLLSRDPTAEPSRNTYGVSAIRGPAPELPKTTSPAKTSSVAPGPTPVAKSRRAEVQRPSANIYVQLAPPKDSDSAGANLQQRIERFMAEAKLTQEQSQKFLALLYDLKVNYQAARVETLRDHRPELAPGEMMPAEEYEERSRGPGVDGGAGMMAEVNAILADEAAARAREFLTEEQVDQLWFIGALPIMATALTYTDGSRVLPSPMK